MDIIWKEQGFIYKGEYRELDEHTLLLDGSLSREEAAWHPHAYCDIREAFAGRELPMSIGLMTRWQQIPCRKKKGIGLPSVCM